MNHVANIALAASDLGYTFEKQLAESTTKLFEFRRSHEVISPSEPKPWATESDCTSPS